jgi:hypothetical protein
VAWPLDKLLTQLASPDTKRRRKAAQEMIGREQSPVDEATVRRLAREDPDAQVRGCAVMELYLRELRDDEAAQAYRRAIADGEWPGRIAGLNGLALVGDTADIALLEPHTRDKDPIMADAARCAIQDIEDGGRRFGEDDATAEELALPWSASPISSTAHDPTAQVIRGGGGWSLYANVLVCAMLALVGLVLLLDGDRSIWALGSIVFFGGGGLGLLWVAVARPRYLTIATAGLEHPALGLIPWTAITDAYVMGTGGSRALVISAKPKVLEVRRAQLRSRWKHLLARRRGGTTLTIIPAFLIRQPAEELMDEINRRARSARREARARQGGNGRGLA